ncbi:MAG: rRNA maturation RNase YbeY [Chloroflexi bacterium]|jgi:probable rRNA maturation factor|nr:rRNA maturation RNase YbeY [Chloroflexota bacterium]BCY18833.1 hypothetical protein hrd7_26820 [Leptolinea sp. HRD-7]
MIHVTRKVDLPEDFSLKKIRRIAGEVFKVMKISGDASIVFTDNNEIQYLNNVYREIDSSTDVLSFLSDEIDPETNYRYLGDVIISVEKAVTQSNQAHHSLEDELTMLIVHGCLHLSGLDHSNPDEKKVMKEKQETILMKLQVGDYAWPEDY